VIDREAVALDRGLNPRHISNTNEALNGRQGDASDAREKDSMLELAKITMKRLE